MFSAFCFAGSIVKQVFFFLTITSVYMFLKFKVMLCLLAKGSVLICSLCLRLGCNWNCVPSGGKTKQNNNTDVPHNCTSLQDLSFVSVPLLNKCSSFVTFDLDCHVFAIVILKLGRFCKVDIVLRFSRQCNEGFGPVILKG